MKKHIIYIFLFIGSFALGQIEQGEATVNRSEDFQQESVTVERIYEPKVEAAEKIKQTPKISVPSQEKMPVSYATKDIEAASDFETTTINADELPVQDSNPYNNYLRAGYGNRASLLVDGFGSYTLDQNNSVGGSLSYRATNGDIPDKITNTDEAKLEAEAFYKLNFEQSQADVRLGGSIHNLDLYGLSDPGNSIDVTDVGQRFDHIYVKGKYNAFDHVFLDDIQLKAGYFTDQQDASETSFDLNTSLRNEYFTDLALFGGMNLGASADVNLNYSHTKFDLNSNNKYNYLTLGIAPKLLFNNDLLSIKAGFNLQYNSESETDISDVHIFPVAEVIVTAVPEFGIYGGLTGGLVQNRYQRLVELNPYLYSDQNIQTTINNIEFYVGLRGEFGDNLRYDARAKYQDLENIPFFAKGLTENIDIFKFNNSFRTVYDDGTRTSIEASLNYLGIENLNLGANLLFQSYDLDNLEDAYDKPGVKASINADYKFLDDRLILGGDLFVVNERKSVYNLVHVDAGYNTQDLDAYVDLNVNATYLITERWAAFAEVNNILNDNYERYLDYDVQGITALGGVMYRF